MVKSKLKNAYKDTRNAFSKYKSCRKLCFHVRETKENTRIYFHFGGYFVFFPKLKVKVTQYKKLSDRFEFSTPKLCKNKCIKHYALKFNVSDFRPMSLQLTICDYFFNSTHLLGLGQNVGGYIL